MMVMEKTRDIAVLMSFGVDPGQMHRIFLLEGLLIAVVGTALGLCWDTWPRGQAGTITLFIYRLRFIRLTLFRLSRGQLTL